MGNLRILSASQQVAAHLRAELLCGRWSGTMPGEDKLVIELGVGRSTVKAALCQLEEQGLLLNRGPGKQRRINVAASETDARSMRVQILLYEKASQRVDFIVELLHMLQEAGYDAKFSIKTLHDLGMDAGRVGHFVKSNPADAWVIVAGSRDVLEWFIRQETPAFSLYGHVTEAPMASAVPRKAGAYAEAVDRFVALGHQRIVLLVREDRRKPAPGFVERHFLKQLERHGIKTGAYHLPDWEESAEGLQAMLGSIFQHTPPTAMIIQCAYLYNAVRHYLGNRGVLVPNHISLLCSDPDTAFEWCLPTVAHFTWDSRTIIMCVVKWMDNISRGKDDRRKIFTEAWLVPGGTMGPAPEEPVG
jgi:DNA-binding LacI/PurR family transcriptional regulator